MTKIHGDFGAATGVANPFLYNQYEAALLSTGQLTASLLDDTGTGTGVGLHIDTAFSTEGIAGTAADTGVGEFPEAVLDGYARTGNGTNSVFRFSGLPSGATYTLQLIGVTASAGRDTQYTVEGVAKDYILGTPASPTAATSFTGTVDPDGEIIVTVEKAASGSFYGYANGFILEYTAAPTSETATTGNIPLVIQAGYTKVDLVDPVTTNASLLFGVTGDAPVTGDDLEYDVTSTLDANVSLSVAANGVWTITETVEGAWVTDITVSRRVVQADGTIGTEATMTFDPTTNNGGGSIQAFRPFSFTKLIKTLMEDGSYSGTGNTIIMNWLVDEGIKRTQLNEMFYKYLGNLGYTGTLNERIKQWENSAINNGFPYTIPFGLS